MHTLTHFHILPHHVHNRLTAFFIVSFIRTFVISFVIIFLPIFIYSTYYSWGQQTALCMVSLYFITMNLVKFAAIPVILWIDEDFGLRGVFGLSYGLLGVSLIFLLLQHTATGLFLMGVSSVSWYFAYHVYASRTIPPLQYGQISGALAVVSLFSAALAPGLAGLILVNGGVGAYYLTALLLLLLGAVSLFYIPHTQKGSALSFASLLRIHQKHIRDFLSFFGAGAQEAVAIVVWPLFLFILFGDLFRVGTYFTFVYLFVSIAYFLVGFLSGKVNPRTLEKIGSGMIFGSWLMRALFQNPLTLGIVEAVYKLFQPFFTLPLLVTAYHHALIHRKSYFLYRECCYSLGALSAFSFLLLIAIAGLPLWIVFLFTAIISLLPMGI